MNCKKKKDYKRWFFLFVWSKRWKFTDLLITLKNKGANFISKTNLFTTTIS